MKVSLSYKDKDVEVHRAVEAEVVRHLPKLQKLLKSYSPDLVQLHGAIEKHPRKIEFGFSLNLSLPTGVLHADGLGPDPRRSVKVAFNDLVTQFKKHQSKLRRDYIWKRKRRPSLA